MLVCIALLFGLRQDPETNRLGVDWQTGTGILPIGFVSSSRTLSNKDLPKTLFLINVWGSWCEYCKREHPFLMQLVTQNVNACWLNYRDKVQMRWKC